MKKVAIIGCGPGGLAAARCLIINTDFEVTIFEKNNAIGGIWLYDDQTTSQTPMYEWLETNLVKDIMNFSDFPFSVDDSNFPRRQQVYKYLQNYYHTFIKGKCHCLFNYNVESVEKKGDIWEVIANSEVFTFQYVVVANGHFEKEYIPTDIEGYYEWSNIDSPSLFHSKKFNNPKPFNHKNVVVVGGGSSGIDIANQISTVASVVYHSVKNISEINWPSNSIVKSIDTISKMNYKKNRSLELCDGTIVENIDIIIWATGYLYDIPFLKTYQHDIFPTDKSPHFRLFNIWKQVAFVKDPTLTFSLLCKNVVPFPLAEIQGCLIAKIYKDQIQVPIEIDDQVEKNKEFHIFSFPSDVKYYQDLLNILNSHNNTDDLFQPQVWDCSRINLRYHNSEMKKLRNKKLIEHAIQLRNCGESYNLNDI